MWERLCFPVGTRGHVNILAKVRGPGLILSFWGTLYQECKASEWMWLLTHPRLLLGKCPPRRETSFSDP